MNRDDVIEKLKATVCDISFIKADGSIRNMTATLNETVLGAEVPETSSVGRQNVYDLNIGAWRSFNWKNLQTVDGERVEV